MSTCCVFTSIFGCILHIHWEICRIVYIYIHIYFTSWNLQKPHSPVGPRGTDPPFPGDLLQSPASASRLDPNPWVPGARSHCLGNLLLEDSVPCVFVVVGGWCHPGLLEKKSDEASDSWLICWWFCIKCKTWEHQWSRNHTASSSLKVQVLYYKHLKPPPQTPRKPP